MAIFSGDSPVDDSVFYAAKEYLWWSAVRSVQTHFEGRFADGSRVPSYESTFERTITKSEARGALHDVMEARAFELARQRTGADDAVPTLRDYANSMRETIRDRVSFLEADGKTVTPYNLTFMGQYAESAESAYALHHMGSAGDVLNRFFGALDKGTLLMSPFDPALADFEATAVAGVDIVGVRLDDGAFGDLADGPFTWTDDGQVVCDQSWFGYGGMGALFRHVEPLTSPFTAGVPNQLRRGSSGITKERGFYVDGAGEVQRVLPDAPIAWGSPVDAIGLAGILPSVRKEDSVDGIAGRLFGWAYEQTQAVEDESRESILDVSYAACREQLAGAEEVAQECLSRGWGVSFTSLGRGSVSMEVDIDEDSFGEGPKVSVIDLNDPGRVGTVFFNGVRYSRFGSGPRTSAASGSRPLVDGEVNLVRSDGSFIIGPDRRPVTFAGGRRSIEIMAALDHAFGEAPLVLSEGADGLSLHAQATDDGVPERRGPSNGIERCRLVRTRRGYEVRPQAFYHSRGASFSLIDSSASRAIAADGSFDGSGSWMEDTGSIRLGQASVSTNSIQFMNPDLMGSPKGLLSKANPEMVIQDLWESAMENYAKTMADVGPTSSVAGIDGNSPASDVLSPLYALADEVRDAREASGDGSPSVDEVSLPMSALESVQRSYLKLLLGESDALELPFGRLVPTAKDGSVDVSAFDGVVVRNQSGSEVYRGEAPFVDVADDETEWVSAAEMARERDISIEDARRAVCELHFEAMRSVALGDVTRDAEGRIVPSKMALAQGEWTGVPFVDGGTHMRMKSLNPAGVALWAQGRGANGAMSERADMIRALSLTFEAGRLSPRDLVGISSDDGVAMDGAVGRLVDDARYFEPDGARRLPELIFEARRGAARHFLDSLEPSGDELVARADERLMADLRGAYDALGLAWPEDASDPEDVWRASPVDFARAADTLPAVAAVGGSGPTPQLARSRYVSLVGESAGIDETGRVDSVLMATLANELDRAGVVYDETDTSADLWMLLDSVSAGEIPSYDDMWAVAECDVLVDEARRRAASMGLVDPIENDPQVSFWTLVRDSLSSTLESQGVTANVDEDVLVDGSGNLSWEGWVFTHATIGNASYRTAEEAVRAAEDVLSSIDASDSVERDRELSIRRVHGLVGPLFAPDHDGIVRSANLASPDWSAVIGWRASMDMSVDAMADTFADKVFFESYSQRMARALSAQVVNDLTLCGQGSAGRYKEVGSCASLVGPFRHMTSGYRHDGVEWGSRERDLPVVVDSAKVLMARDAEGEPVLSFDERVAARRRDMVAMGPHVEALAARGEASRVVFPTVFREEASPIRSVQRSLGMEPSGDDTYFDLWQVMGERSIWVKTDRAFEGIFDQAGPMTSLAQGSVGFLVQGAQVDENGNVRPASAEDGPDAMHSYLLSDRAGVLDNSRGDPADRENMAVRAVLDARGVTPPIGVVCASIGGWTMDGGIVISAEMADSCQVEDAADPGHLRSLRPGDKLSDLHGNKGVISLVVPPKPGPGESTPPLSASERKVAELFWANEGRVQMVMEPYFWSGRMASGGYAEARDNLADMPAGDLVLERPGNDNGSVDFGIALQPIVVAHQTADSKTKRYGDAPGEGRKASAQLAQVLAAKGAYDVGRALYGRNNGFVDILDERLRSLGYLATADGHLGELTSVEDGASERERMASERLLGRLPLMRERRVMWVGPDDAVDSNGFGALSNGTWYVGRASESREGVASEISRVGGVLALPFPITLASGDRCPVIRRPGEVHESWEVGLPEGEAGRWSPWNLEEGVWGFPVEPVSMRFESNGLEGSIPHDDTRLYLRLAELAGAWQATWREDVKAITHLGGGMGPDSQRMALVTSADRAHARELIEQVAQRTYDQAVPRLERLAALSVRRSGVSVPQGKSAHVVIYPNPDLSMSQVAMPEDMRAYLGVNLGDRVFDFRDPTIQSGNCASSEVVGAKGSERAATDAIGKQPAWDKQADADFDGDMEGVWALSDEAAQAEASRDVCVSARLLDFVQPADERGLKGAFANMGLDVASGMALDPSIASRYEEWKERAAEHFKGREPWVRAKATELEAEGDRVLLAELDQIVWDAYDVKGAFAEDVLVYSPDPWEHLRSLYVASVEHAGKGSLSKLSEFARRGGFGRDGKGLSDEELASIVEGRHTDIDWVGASESRPEDLAASEFATATKSAFTGRAGKFLQLMVAQASWHSPEAAWCVSAMTALVTQALLQAKHDADQALTLASAVTDAMNHLWCGHRFKVVRDENGFFDHVECAKVDNAYLGNKVFSEMGGGFAHATTEEWVEEAVELFDSLGVGFDPAIAKAMVSFDVPEEMLEGSKACRGLLWSELPDMSFRTRSGEKSLSDISWTDPETGERRSYGDGGRYMVGAKTTSICDGVVPVFQSEVAKLGFEKRSFANIQQAAMEHRSIFGGDGVRDNYAAIVEPDSVRRAKDALERSCELSRESAELFREARRVEPHEAVSVVERADEAAREAEALVKPRAAESLRSMGRGVASRQASRDLEDAPEDEVELDDLPLAVGE